MSKHFLLLVLFLGFITSILAQDNRQVLLDKGFLEKIPENPNLDNISSQLHTMPIPTGTYSVGVKTFEISDETREERLIPIWVYFPIEKGDHKAYQKVIEEKGLDLFEIREVWQKLNIQVYSKHVNNLESLKNSGKHPVILFNHGNGMLLHDHSFLLEDLASHGYIIISIQNQLKTDKKEPARNAKRAVSDQNKVIINNLCVFDWLKNNNSLFFYDSLDLSKIGVIGYSMGANASLLWADRVCRNGNTKTLFQHSDENNVKECIVSLDGQRISFPFSNEIPLFMLISEKREKEQRENGEYELMQKIGHKFAYYKNTHHGSFSDHAYLNIKTHLSPDIQWFYGTTEERMKFFDDVRKDVREFLEKQLVNSEDLDEKENLRLNSF